MLSTIFYGLFTAWLWVRREATIAWRMATFNFSRPDVPDGICHWGRPFEDHDHETECTSFEELPGGGWIMVMDEDD